MQNTVKILSLCVVLFASFNLQAQSSAGNPSTASTALDGKEGKEKARGYVFVAAKKDDQPNDPYRSQVFTATTGGTANLTLNIPLWHSVKQPYVTFENLTKGTYQRFTTWPGEAAYRTITVTLQAGDQYRLTASIQPNPSDPNDDTDEDVLATLSW
ncbi:hypothetical protein [Chitinophaga eiseniae]|uniref:Uncharacterized protein n=1 Tax=Chitinophaga eiseniae TaxID=634771 RepID=A0A847SWC8_9BACT|nr:hypothetical protein [Chitinophaga eiseniae]NLR82489.1 hypothetical protein [Chitinophaga eiseniae]